MFANLLFLTKKIKKIRKIHEEVTKLQASKLSKSANFVRIFCQSNSDQKVSTHACVGYTVLHAIVHADWPIQIKCSQLRSRVRELGPLVLRSTNPLLPTLRFSVIKIQIYHSRRLKGEERDSKSRRKKARGSLSTVRAAPGFVELAQLR